MTAPINRALELAFDDPTLSAFYLNYFPRVYDRFAQGMRKDEKIILLLDYCRRLPTGFETLLDAVREEYQMSNPPREELSPLIDALEAYLSPPLTQTNPKELSGQSIFDAEARLERKANAILTDLEDVSQKVIEELKKEVITALHDDSVVISDDGLPISDQNQLPPPLKQFNPQVIDGLFEPSGIVRLRDQFYVEREADALLKDQVTEWGTMTTIRAPRQTGKSSLLIRGLHYARQNGLNVVRLDLQRVDPNKMQSPEAFLHYLARFIVRKLRLDGGEVAKAWQSLEGPQDKLTYFMEDYILPQSGERLVLMIDEADRLLATGFHNDFFALMRSWHNEAAADEEWEKLNICLVISTEPHLLISDITQSPFNVGKPLYLKDFTEAQVRDLNQRHGSPVSAQDLPALMELLNGHPYLTRRALYTMVTKQLSWGEFRNFAMTDDGPFADHLNYHYRLLHNENDLRKALKQIMNGNLPDDKVLYRLSRSGLVKGSGQAYKLRCDLYRLFFENKW